ncbi:MAG: hypothetical protein K2J60_13280 [Acetatifactor sp.]|nr:hypothetical protein [Acetatifactor sp.]
MKVIILGVGTVTKRIINQILKYKDIDIIGAIPDRSAKLNISDEYTRFLEGKKIKICDFNDASLPEADIVFTATYPKLLPAELVDKYRIINLHAGILPKYRGFCSNVWAIINGEPEVGFTIHRMDRNMDNGDIYHVEHIPISKEQTYSDVYEELTNKIVEKTPEVLRGICSGDLRAIKQEGKRVYCSKITPELGMLSDFNQNTDYICNLFRAMAEPHGTGVYFMHNGVRYDVGKVESGVKYDIDDYCCLPGKVVNIEEDSESNVRLFIKSKDNVVVLSRISENGKLLHKSPFGVGHVL